MLKTPLTLKLSENVMVYPGATQPVIQRDPESVQEARGALLALMRSTSLDPRAHLAECGPDATLPDVLLARITNVNGTPI
jgi:hypothetical protein